MELECIIQHPREWNWYISSLDTSLKGFLPGLFHLWLVMIQIEVLKHENLTLGIIFRD